MMSLELFSEPYQPTGGIASEGIRNVLGRPALELLTLLVREAGQNTWDARRSDDIPVDLRFDAWELTPAQIEVAQGEVFLDEPANIPLKERLDGNPWPCVLMVSDRGTTGLGGPLRADEVTGRDEPHDFVDFLRNIGQPRDKRFGGGTYGYGKSVLYNASGVRTILVYTRCCTSEGYQSRLIGAALGDQYEAHVNGQARPFTGRHWWGHMAEGVIDPVLDAEADELAWRMGFAVMTDTETGTSIMILDPLFEARTGPEAMAYLVEASLWSFWPNMVSVDESPPRLRVHASWKGEEIQVTSPADHPRLRGFVGALREAERSTGSRRPITIDRPRRHLGWMAFHRFAVTDPDPGRAGADAAPIGPGVHHAALMRTPRNIVKYVAGDPLPHEAAGYAAVFIADAAVDSAFAAAEPPSHDDWLPAVLERGWDKRFVTVALRNIRRELQNHVAPPAPPRGRDRMPPLGAIANELASMFPWEAGPGAGVALTDGVSATPGDPGASTASRGGGSERGRPGGTDGAGSSRSGRARVEIDGAPQLEVEVTGPVIRLRFMVRAAAGSPATVVSADARVAVQDGEAVEDEPPEGADMPRVLRWEDPDGRPTGGEGQIEIPASREGPWAVVVTSPGDTAVAVNLAAKPWSSD
jgi:hypothetical protein